MKPALRLVHSKPDPTVHLRTGYAPSYRIGQANHCPYCSGTSFTVGRVNAECARCGGALPIAGNRVAGEAG